MIIDAALTTVGIGLGLATLTAPIFAGAALARWAGTSPAGWRIRARRSVRRYRRHPTQTPR